MFSVEQIELVRRLRNSGITKAQIIKAYDALDNIEQEIGSVYNIPYGIQNHVQGLASALVTQMQLMNHHQHLAKQENGDQKQLPVPQQLVEAAVSFARNPGIPSQMNVQNSGALNLNNNETMNHNTTQQGNLIATSNYGSLQQSVGEPVKTEFPPSRQPNLSGFNNTSPSSANDDSPEMIEFLKLGPYGMYEEVKTFVQQNSIKQHQVAALTGLSQSYVSRFLKGDYGEMSERCRRCFYRFYLTYKSNPTVVATMALSSGDPSMASGHRYRCTTQTGENCGNFPMEVLNRKRDRFVFRPEHLEILERNFEEDQYPSIVKREAIAQKCNQATASKSEFLGAGNDCGVSTQVITNWFANKRKEIKRFAKEEGRFLLPGLGNTDYLTAAMSIYRQRNGFCYQNVSVDRHPMTQSATGQSPLSQTTGTGDLADKESSRRASEISDSDDKANDVVSMERTDTKSEMSAHEMQTEDEQPEDLSLNRNCVNPAYNFSELQVVYPE